MKKALSVTYGVFAVVCYISAFYILFAQPSKEVNNDSLFAIGFIEGLCFTALFLYTQRLINGSVAVSKKKGSTGKVLAIIILAILLCFADNLMAQNAKVDGNGNYVSVKVQKDKEPAKETGSTFTDNKGNVYPVYVSKNGKLFYQRTSKAGNVYKAYLKL